MDLVVLIVVFMLHDGSRDARVFEAPSRAVCEAKAADLNAASLPEGMKALDAKCVSVKLADRV